MKEKKEESLGVTFTGDVTFNGPMFDIHDNEVVTIGKPDKEICKGKPAKVKKNDENTDNNDEELFKFIHPSIDSEQEIIVHNEVTRLVKHHGIQEICTYLKQMADEKKILLPMNPGMAYKELTRIGMPHGSGFNEKTFQKHYKR